MLVLRAADGPEGRPRRADPAERAAGSTARAQPVEAAEPAPGRVTVAGWVRRGGRPVAARVEVRPWPEDDPAPFPLFDAPPLAVAEAGPDGAFAFTDPLPPGRYVALARPDSGEAAYETFRVGPGLRSDFVVDLPRATSVVEGTAVYASGVAFDGYLGCERFPPVRAGPGGEFRLPASGSLVVVTVLFPDGSSRSVRLSAPSTGCRIVVDEGSLRLRGRVVRVEDDAPISDARILAAQGWYETGPELGRTDSDGSFEVRILPGTSFLEVSAPGRARKRFAASPAPEPIVVRLTPEAAVHGRVIAEADGRPLPGVVVHLIDPRNYRETQAHTDAEGRFSFANIPAGEAVVFAAGGGFASPDVAADEFLFNRKYIHDLRPGEGPELLLEAVPSATIEVLLRDADGRPEPGGLVSTMADLDFGYLDQTGPTDPRGLWRTELPPGIPWAIYARSRKQASVRPKPGEVLAFEFAASPVAELTFRVFDEDDGAPVSASIRARNSGGETVVGVTDAEGLCRGQVPVGGSIEFSVYSPTHRSTEARIWRPGEPPHIEFGVKRGLDVSGRIEATSIPLDLTLRLSGPGGNEMTRPDMEGRFVFRNLPEGMWRIRATVQGLVTEADVPAGASGVVLRLPEPEGEFLVRVEGPDGRPVPEATLRIEWWGSPGAVSSERRVVSGGVTTLTWRAGLHAAVLSGADARDEFGARIACDFPPVRLESRPSAPVVIRLPAGRPIRGRVVDDRGVGLPGVLVTVQEHWRVRTGSAGEFETGGPAEGPVEILLPELPVPVVVAAAGASDVLVRLPKLRSATVTVRTREGAPLPGMDVAVETDELYLYRSTDQEGRATFSALPEDEEYLLRVEDPAFDEVLRWAPHVQAGWRPGDVEVVLTLGLYVEGIVVDPRGEPRSISLRAEQGDREVYGKSLGDGSFRIGPLPPGTVEVYGGKGDLARATVAAGATGIRLQYPPPPPLVLRFDRLPAAERKGESLSIRSSGTGGTGNESLQIFDLGDGSFGVYGVMPGGRYDVFASWPEAGRVALLAGIRGDAGAVVAAVVPPQEVVLTPVGAEADSVRSVTVIVGVFEFPAARSPDGSWRATGLPPGPYVVRVATAVPGGPLDVRLFEGVAGPSFEVDLGD